MKVIVRGSGDIGATVVPSLATIMKVMKALGLRLSVAPAAHS